MDIPRDTNGLSQDFTQEFEIYRNFESYQDVN